LYGKYQETLSEEEMERKKREEENPPQTPEK